MKQESRIKFIFLHSCTDGSLLASCQGSSGLDVTLSLMYSSQHHGGHKSQCGQATVCTTEPLELLYVELKD